MSSIANILVVDDNPKYLNDILPLYGYEVTVANDGIEALNILENPTIIFDLLILDIIMPNMDGWETLKTIRNTEKIKSIPIIMLTAIDSEQKEVAGLRFGADDYISKPFSLPNLLARIEALLRRSNWNKTKIQVVQKKHFPFNTEEHNVYLTTRENEVLKLVAQGASNQFIAKKLLVREVTIKTHLNSIFKKLNVSNRTQAVLIAIKMGLV